MNEEIKKTEQNVGLGSRMVREVPPKLLDRNQDTRLVVFPTPRTPLRFFIGILILYPA